MATAANLPNRFQLFLTYLVPLDVDVLPIKFHQFLFWQATCYDHICVFQLFNILSVSMATAAILKKINP